MSTSVLATTSFWRDLLERAGRQAAQTALPIVAAIGAAGTINAKAVAIAIIGAVVLTVVKALVTVKVTPGEDVLSALLDRAVPAAAGTALGMWPVDALNIMAVDWSAVLWASLAAAVIAMLAYYVTPPANPPTSDQPTESGVHPGVVQDEHDDDTFGEGPLGAHEVL